MIGTYIPLEVRQRVAATAQHRCEYCQTQEVIVGMPLEVEHIIPEVAGGSSDVVRHFPSRSLTSQSCNASLPAGAAGNVLVWLASSRTRRRRAYSPWCNGRSVPSNTACSDPASFRAIRSGM